MCLTDWLKLENAAEAIATGISAPAKGEPAGARPGAQMRKGRT